MWAMRYVDWPDGCFFDDFAVFVRSEVWRWREVVGLPRSFLAVGDAAVAATRHAMLNFLAEHDDVGLPWISWRSVTRTRLGQEWLLTGAVHLRSPASPAAEHRRRGHHGG